MKTYEAPRINFDKLLIFEKIADTCWGVRNGTLVGFNDPLLGKDYTFETKVPVTRKGGCGEDELDSFCKGVNAYYITVAKDEDIGNAQFLKWKKDNVDCAANHLQQTKTQWCYIPS